MVGAVLSVLGMGGVVLGILVVAGGRRSGRRAPGRSARWRWGRWSGGSLRRKREAKPTLLDPDLFTSKIFRFGVTGQMLQQIALGGTMIALPIFLQMVLEYNAMEAGLSLAPLSLTHVRGGDARREEGRERAAEPASSARASRSSRSGWCC